MSRLEGSRWRLRWAREMPLAMEFEWGFFRPLFGAKRACGHFQECGGERQIPPHAWRIITGGEYFSVPPSEYEKSLDTILMQLHFRYELGFIPPAIDGKRHEPRVELTKAATAEHKGLRLRHRPEYIPVQEEPEWAH